VRPRRVIVLDEGQAFDVLEGLDDGTPFSGVQVA